MKRTILVTLIALSAIMIQSCSEDEATPAAQASIKMMAVTGSSAPAGGRVANTALTFTEVFAGVTEIELETLEEDLEEEENGESENEEVEFEGNFVINFLTGTSNPDLGLSELTAGVYQEVEVEFDNILEGGKTLIINFNFTPTDAAEPTLVEFSTTSEFELEIENEAGLVLDGGMVNSILVTLDLNALFAAIDFSSLTADGDGVIRINESSNDEVMQSIVEGLESALDADEEDEDEEDEN